MIFNEEEEEEIYNEVCNGEAARLLLSFLQHETRDILYRIDRGYLTEDDVSVIKFMVKLFGEAMRDDLNRANVEKIKEKYRRMGDPLFSCEVRE